MFNKRWVWWWVLWILMFAVAETFALFDHNPTTPSLTEFIIHYLKWWMTVPFLIWLLAHFTMRYVIPGWKTFRQRRRRK